MERKCPTGSKLTIAAGRQIQGAFCKEQVLPKSRFDTRSFRRIRSGKAWLTVGCPKGKFRPRTTRTVGRAGHRRRITGVCDVGTKTHVILRPLPRGGSGMGCPGEPQTGFGRLLLDIEEGPGGVLLGLLAGAVIAGVTAWKFKGKGGVSGLS